MAMRWNLHGRVIDGHTNDNALACAWAQSFASLPASQNDPDISIQLDVVTAVPAAPERAPDFQQGELLRYYVDNGAQVTVHFPRYGALYLDLEAGTTRGQLVGSAVETYGVLEDMVAIGLTPHLRRCGFFLIHAFAAAPAGARAALIVGSMGAGKTTTGMALLDAGWHLLSNDSPIIDSAGDVRQYPGVLAAYPDTFARFSTTAELATHQPARHGRRKLVVTAESIWPDVWLDQAAPGGIFFPQIEARETHALTPLSAIQTLQRLLPHAIEQWDKPMMPRHLAALRRLVERAPGFVLHLGPQIDAIPAVLAPALRI